MKPIQTRSVDNNQYAQLHQYAEPNQYAQPKQYFQNNQYSQTNQYSQSSHYPQSNQYSQSDQYSQSSNINQYTQPFPSNAVSTEEGRYLRPDTIYKISETLGALNTVGSYIVNMTRGIETDPNAPQKIPGALYTLSKNVLGRNVTDVIAPLVREALPGVIQPIPTPARVTTETPDSKGCTTPDGAQGYGLTVI